WGMSAIKLVQAFTKEEEEHRRFMGASRESLRATLRLYSWQTLYSGAVNLVIAGGTALVVYAGARAVMSGALTVGQLIVFISYLAQLYAPINQITQSWALIAGARVRARRVVEVRDYQLKSPRDQISMVLQPPLIFPLSVRDNIAYGRPGAADSEIEGAARLARIHDLIASLPEGYDTVVGESGMALSEGEKQRVTIARALLRDAPILILDEPTSALDVATEALVMAGIERLMAGRTTFVIAHRLSTVR